MAETLKDRIYDGKELTGEEIDALVGLLGSGCRENTKRELRYTLAQCPRLTSYGIYDRVWLAPQVRYIPGQSYTDEVRTVRNCLLGRR